MKCNVNILKRKGKKGVSYSIQWVDPRTGRRKTETVGRDRSLAQRMAADRRQELLEGRCAGITRISYDDFTKEHIEAVRGQLAPGTCHEHELVLGQFKEICDPKSLTCITFAMLETFRQARLKAGNKPSTMNKSLRSLQSVLNYAVRRNYLKVNPFTGNRRALWLKEPEPTPKVVPYEDYQRLFDACPDDQWRAILTIAYYAGLRRGEILHLEWSDVDFDSGLLHVANKEGHFTKTRKYRQVPMAPQVVESLKKLEMGRFKSKYLMTFKHHHFDHIYHRICRAAGLVDDNNYNIYKLHDFRVTCATNMQRQGVPVKVCQRILGHADMATTAKYYLGADEQDLRDAIKKVSAINA